MQIRRKNISGVGAFKLFTSLWCSATFTFTFRSVLRASKYAWITNVLRNLTRRTVKMVMRINRCVSCNSDVRPAKREIDFHSVRSWILLHNAINWSQYSGKRKNSLLITRYVKYWSISISERYNGLRLQAVTQKSGMIKVTNVLKEKQAWESNLRNSAVYIHVTRGNSIAKFSGYATEVAHIVVLSHTDSSPQCTQASYSSLRFFFFFIFLFFCVTRHEFQ